MPGSARGKYLFVCTKLLGLIVSCGTGVLSMSSAARSIPTDHFQTLFSRRTIAPPIRRARPRLQYHSVLIQVLSVAPALTRSVSSLPRALKERVIYPTLQTTCAGYDQGGRDGHEDLRLITSRGTPKASHLAVLRE
ncbi:hypothetical protein F5144DRAFT_258681 [Chaetomium tenue]|uniref:Uncharacterized protein n=1 Tax=Chaetomium tenue TaxID=1854479 RepID=A0ACB7PB35_9PEZI|nr:hypothetical protein F5144DRAFT_258681 [Chaetomium globosum]